MQGKIDPSIAETVASASLAAASLVPNGIEDISRISSAVEEDQGRFVPGTLLGGQVEGVPFISMEYVDGEDLASLLLRIGRLPAGKALETARKLCAGLAAAHDRGVIHRDLKPQNIMMNKRGEVVIMDFGLAAVADQLSGAEVRNGTPAYMSPEQLKGAGVTSRSDLYALGLVLYELFTGKRPYEASSLQQLIDLQDSAQLTSMISVAAGHRSGGGEDRSALPGTGPCKTSGHRPGSGVGAAGRRSAGCGAGRRRNAVPRNGGRGRQYRRAGANSSNWQVMTLV